MSVVLSASNFATNNSEYGLLNAAIEVTGSIPEKTKFSFLLPNVDDGRYSKPGCFVYTSAADGTPTDINYVTTSGSWIKKDSGYVIDANIGTKAITTNFNIVCHVKAPETSANGLEGTFSMLDQQAKFGITITQDQIAGSVDFLATGDFEKPGLTLNIKNSAYDNISFIHISSGKNLIVKGEDITSGDDCDVKVNSNSYSLKVSEVLDHLVFTVPSTVTISKTDDISIKCSTTSKTFVAKKVPGYPAIANISVKQSLIDVVATSHTLAEMQNSAFSLATGAAVVATAASVLAYFF